jgi:hypothetical protein
LFKESLDYRQVFFSLLTFLIELKLNSFYDLGFYWLN